jgi:hypothetical protein
MFNKTFESKIISEASSIIIDFGNSSPFMYESAYLPLLELISRILFSNEKVNGWSGRDFSISINNFAGTAILTLIEDSIEILDDREVSRSDEVIVKLLFSISNKKLSRIGNVLFVFKIEPRICKFFNNSVEDIMNFI